ncbi:acyl-CoA carboxylase subunit epsilon [Nocardioides yefusunii]|uniref:Acyl-CoA carboxylase subunit epsilon n=1 Tax=Nocardioides yefusunii TaxID=2500546 RepID=A0ABW1R2W3_9ACTN|nr:acyl-CoA carboxylase subunit epsilon [Nocardioides yefusunii]
MTEENAASTEAVVDKAPAAPVLQVVTPDATPQEIAALVAIFSAMGGAEAPKPKARSEWANPARAVRPSLSSGFGGWRASGLPR